MAVLSEELEGYHRSARAAHAEATDPQCKAENKYDTRGLEASYLAHGQSQNAAEVVQALEQFGALTIRAFGKGDAIDIGALVELERGGETVWYFMGPKAGGTEVKMDGGTVVLVITPQSPMGQQLMRHKQGERFDARVGRKSEKIRILEVK